MNKKTYNIKELFNCLDKYDFSEVDIADKKYIIYSLACYIKNISLNELKLNIYNIEFTENEIIGIESSLIKIINDKVPLQYILEYTPFYNEKYYVNENVLIPRQDTEIVVQKAIEYINKYGLKTMLDMCAGSGIIGISVGKNSSIDDITFVDISKDALNVLEKNIIINKLNKKYSVICSDLFQNLMTLNKSYDIIISNPPYIKTKDVECLSEYVKNEPHIALDGGADGLDVYRRIVDDARNFLNNNGFLILEIGYDQKEDLISLIDNYNDYELVEVEKDLNLNDRVIICRLHKT